MSELSLQKLTAVLLAGGLGTRLRRVLQDVPKPMAPVGGRPFLELIIAQLCEAGVRDVIICVGYKREKIEAHFGRGVRHGVHIRYAREVEPLGTGGALSALGELIKSEPFLVLNGDSYCDVDLKKLYAAHHAKNANYSIVTTQVSNGSRYGSVAIGDGDKIEGFVEKGLHRGATWINAGIYLFGSNILTKLPQIGKSSLEHEIFPGLVEDRLYAFKTSGRFIDIGVPEDFERAQGMTWR